MKDNVILQLEHIQKSYSGNVVLDDISFSVREGEIVALSGENGAGKSTLMNILFGMGVIQATGGYSGNILIDGKPVNISSPNEAMKLGIGMVHQEFMLLPGFSVARNIKLNRENLRGSAMGRLFGKTMDLLDTDGINRDAKKSLERLGMDIATNVPTGRLPVGHMQFVEIAREIDKKNLRLLVLDEPTAVLTESEADTLLSCIRQVADNGIGVIFISHRLDEVIKLTDRVVVLRDGVLVFESDTAKTNKKQIAEMMVGRGMDAEGLAADKRERLDAEPVLRVDHLAVDMPGERARDVSFSVKKGEIFGIGGLAGHGKTSISNAIFGMYPAKGDIVYENEPLDCGKVGEALEKGIGFVSEDRKGVGLLLDESILHNVVFTDMQIHRHFLKKFGPLELFDQEAAEKRVQELIDQLDIRCTSPRQLVGSLSGGNQQKVCMARVLASSPKLMLVSEPTRGIDIGAKQLLLNTLQKLNRELGLTIVITSSELNELRSVCDRIAIVTNGEVAGILSADAPSVDFALLMSGEELEKEGAGE